ncbi:hypothetical protein BCR42DRAFT_387049 [Absidia repens]|uniref:Uncharacterized protein n=1 Tax=Absidia repens TaxID=90262 RepID=A0A1X2IY27_9FUNG|nr:hypothetical protein BCR42DRAFT_387049 [Absidia repens]
MWQNYYLGQHSERGLSPISICYNLVLLLLLVPSRYYFFTPESHWENTSMCEEPFGMNCFKTPPNHPLSDLDDHFYPYFPSFCLRIQTFIVTSIPHNRTPFPKL